METVGAGAGKSGCFWGVLRWSVGRHGSSDLDEHSVGRLERIRQSVLRRIAWMHAGDRVLGWRALTCGQGQTPLCEKVGKTAFLAEIFDDLHWKSLLGR